MTGVEMQCTRNANEQKQNNKVRITSKQSETGRFMKASVRDGDAVILIGLGRLWPFGYNSGGPGCGIAHFVFRGNPPANAIG